MKTLGTRALTALVFVVVLLGSLLWNYYSFTIFFFLVAMMGLNEFYKLSEKLDAQPHKWFGLISGALVYISFINFNFTNATDQEHLKLFVVLVPFIIFSIALFSGRTKPIQNSVYTIAGILYAVLPFALLHSIVSLDYLASKIVIFQPQLLLGIILLIWSNDTFAYLGGSLFGKHKMIERISPGKTWEGTIFGVLMTIASSYIVGELILQDRTSPWLLFGILVPILSTIGDLVESLLKRQAGIKDTGNIMPGHGGILDRFDSLIFVAPFVYVILKLL
ncbi:phosphatidate cytidylyltransferase [Aurantibacillus circumpalustris]|uniref:phosphatidate cytidylyltransferase n=1 Tax=Aurantibacillus circumpalustris TaxID=3036359 RepID=UPI00295C140B|nr:phosphatidate cytidylyltransferase [Aurantibacillus circumpalustris]